MTSEVADRRQVIAHLIRDAPAPLGVAEIAAGLGVHPNTVRFHLDALLAAGRVERLSAPAAGPGRPAALFRARRGMDLTGPRNYRLLAAIGVTELAADPQPVARATEVGRRWGGELMARPADGGAGREETGVRRLVGLLADLGFAPEERATDGAPQIGLRNCPFLELVGQHAQVICALHLGLMQGALAALGSRSTVARLEPFAAPDLCVAHLTGPPPKTPQEGTPS